MEASLVYLPSFRLTRAISDPLKKGWGYGRGMGSSVLVMEPKGQDLNASHSFYYCQPTMSPLLFLAVGLSRVGLIDASLLPALSLASKDFSPS